MDLRPLGALKGAKNGRFFKKFSKSNNQIVDSVGNFLAFYYFEVKKWSDHHTGVQGPKTPHFEGGQNSKVTTRGHEYTQMKGID